MHTGLPAYIIRRRRHPPGQVTGAVRPGRSHDAFRGSGLPTLDCPVEAPAPERDENAKLRFEPDLDFQLQAIEAICDRTAPRGFGRLSCVSHTTGVPLEEAKARMSVDIREALSLGG